MKKLVSAILVICLAALIVLSVPQIKAVMEKNTSAQAPAAQQAETQPAVDATSEIMPVPAGKLDYEALFAAYDPNEIAVTINDHEITWGEYYTWITYYTTNLEYYMNMYAMYGYVMSWGDVINEETGATAADEAIATSKQFIEQIYNTLDYAEANGYLTDDVYAKVEEDVQAEIANYIANGNLPEGAGIEEFDAFLESNHSDIEQYRMITLFGEVADKIYNDMFGENNEKVSDEDAVAYFTENGYVFANHILFMNTNRETGEAYSEEKLAELKAFAQQLADELNAIEDPAERVARFLELKAEYDEDTGKEYYPDGYVFTYGEMVEEFDTAARELGAYEVSGPVESMYGYHVILRMPDDPDVIIMSENVSAREICGTQQFNVIMEGIMESAKAELTPACEGLNLLDYVA